MQEVVFNEWLVGFVFCQLFVLRDGVWWSHPSIEVLSRWGGVVALEEGLCRSSSQHDPHLYCFRSGIESMYSSTTPEYSFSVLSIFRLLEKKKKTFP